MPRIDTVTTAFEGGIFRVDVLELTSGAGQAMRRDVVRHAGAVAIIPRLDDERLVMVRNYRVAVDQWLLEIPAGGIDPDEPPHVAAARELAEETGYRAGRLSEVGTFYTSPGYSDERMHVFVADDLASGEQNLDPGEELTVEIHEAAAVRAMVLDGRIVNAVTIAALAQLDHAEREAGASSP